MDLRRFEKFQGYNSFVFWAKPAPTSPRGALKRAAFPFRWLVRRRFYACGRCRFKHQAVPSNIFYLLTFINTIRQTPAELHRRVRRLLPR